MTDHSATDSDQSRYEKSANLQSGKALRIPALDGIRALSVTLVFLGHAGMSRYFTLQVSGQLAPLGVTVFFFLSGYIITTLMRAEVESTGELSFKKFYLRRLFRIFPPLYIVLFLAWVAAALSLTPSSYTTPGLVSQLVHFTNYFAAFNGPADFLPGMLLTWSLAVEEHFYLLFPLVFVTLVGRMQYRSAALVLAVFCGFCLAWRCVVIFFTDFPPSYTYYATDTRIDSIMFGCIMGLWCNPALDKEVVTNFLTKVVVIAGSLGALLFSVAFKPDVFSQTVMYTVQGLALFPLFYLAVTNSNWLIFRWLDWAPMRGLGIVSYTFYLSHGLILRLSENIIREASIQRDLLGFTLTVIFCTVMWYAIEKPMARTRKKLHTTPKKAASAS